MSCTSWTKTLNDRNNWQQYDLRKQNADFFSSSVFLRTHPLRLRVFPFMFMLLLLHSPIHSSPIHQHSNSQSYGFLSLCVWVCMRANERKEFAFGAGIRNKQRPRGAIWRRWRRVMFGMGILYRKIKMFNFSTMQFRQLFFLLFFKNRTKDRRWWFNEKRMCRVRLVYGMQIKIAEEENPTQSIRFGWWFFDIRVGPWLVLTLLYVCYVRVWVACVFVITSNVASKFGSLCALSVRRYFCCWSNSSSIECIEKRHSDGKKEKRTREREKNSTPKRRRRITNKTIALSERTY